MSQWFKLFPLTVMIAVATVACGGDGPKNPTAPSAPPAPAPAPPPAPVTNVIAQGGSGLPSRILLIVPFTTTATGTIGTTVDWTFATNNVDIFLARGTNPCSVEQFNNNQCAFLGFSASRTAKPETVSVPNLAAGPYTLYIGNLGSTDESVSYQVTLTTVPRTGASPARTQMGGATIPLRGSVQAR